MKKRKEPSQQKPSRRPPPGVFIRPDRDGFWILYRDERGRRIRERTEARTMTEAANTLALKKAQVERNRVLGITPPSEDEVKAKDITFAEIAQRFLSYQTPRLTPAAFDRARGIVEDHLKPFFKRKLSEITAAHVEDFVTKRLIEVKPATVKKELQILKHLLKKCVGWELLDASPAAAVKPPKVDDERTRYLEPDELRAVARACPDWLKPIVALALFTGMRRAEILGLRWSKINLNRRRLELGKTKNGHPRFVRLNQGALAALAVVPRRSDDDLLFPEIEGSTVSVAFKRVCRRLGVMDFRFHDLRHCTGSWLTMNNVPNRVVGEVLGHRDSRMTRRYQQLADEFVDRAVAQLDKTFGDFDEILGIGNHQEATTLTLPA